MIRKNHPAVHAALLGVALLRAPLAQDPAAAGTAPTGDPFVHLQIRVISASGGGRGPILIDRGSRDLLETGDIVVLTPRSGGIHRGTVVKVTARNSEIRLNQAGFVAAPGMPGEVLVPKARRLGAAPVGEAPASETPADRQPAADPSGEEPDRPTRWRNSDEVWRPGMPLLTGGLALQPEDRPSRLTGRVWAGGDHVNIDGDTSNSYFRTGANLDWENPGNRGGALHLDAEFLQRTELDASDGISSTSGSDLLLRRFSYSWGGDRFRDSGFEVGRFLQRGMPEFGYLDGAEWSHRSSDGDRFGVSVGYLPEPDDDFESFEDLQIAAHYQWAFDPAERTTLALGFQQTVHDGDLDRDLLVTKFRHLPDEATAWDFHATFWVDFYLGDDNNKDVNLEITQAFVATGRSFADGSRVDVAWRRVAFPDTQRMGEFLPVTPAQIRDDVYDRLTLDWTASYERAVRPHVRLLGYLDEEDGGGGADLGLDFRDVLSSGDHLDLIALGQHGEFNSLLGGRAVYSLPTSDLGRFDLLYEFTFSRYEGFADDRDDLITHRISLADAFRLGDSWDVSLQAGVVTFDDTMAWNAGCFIQHSF